MMAATTSSCTEHEAYWSLIKNMQADLSPQFVEDFELQSAVERERGRAVAIEFQEGEKAQITNFGDSTDALDRYFDDPVNGFDPPPLGIHLARRRLFVLEDLGRNKVTVLGSHLRIPPALFAAHWTDPSFSAKLVEEDMLTHSNSKYFRVTVPQLHRVVREDGYDDYRLGLYQPLYSNVQRWLQLLDKERTFEPSQHQVSYWSTTYGNGSWTVVLLVDPVITEAFLYERNSQSEPHVILLDHPDMGKYRLPNPCVASMDPLPPSPTQWHPLATTRTPSSISFFDNLLTFYTTMTPITTADPRTASTACRHLVLVAWGSFLGSKALENIRFHDISKFTRPLSNSQGWFHNWDTTWRADAFHNLLYQQIGISLLSAGTRQAMRAFGVGSPNTVVDEREAADWEALEKEIMAFGESVASQISGYTQEASIEESRTANFQARNVGRLTALATVLVPFSVTAGVFSMGGDFAAGQRLFWVFWVIAVPVAVLSFAAVSFYERRQSLAEKNALGLRKRKKGED